MTAPNPHPGTGRRLVTGLGRERLTMPMPFPMTRPEAVGYAALLWAMILLPLLPLTALSIATVAPGLDRLSLPLGWLLVGAAFPVTFTHALMTKRAPPERWETYRAQQ